MKQKRISQQMGNPFFYDRKLAQWASEGVDIRPDELWS